MTTTGPDLDSNQSHRYPISLKLASFLMFQLATSKEVSSELHMHLLHHLSKLFVKLVSLIDFITSTTIEIELMKLYILPPLVHYLKTIMRKLKKL
jgi:hypothetical protein